MTICFCKEIFIICRRNVQISFQIYFLRNALASPHFHRKCVSFVLSAAIRLDLQPELREHLQIIMVIVGEEILRKT